MTNKRHILGSEPICKGKEKQRVQRKINVFPNNELIFNNPGEIKSSYQ